MDPEQSKKTIIIMRGAPGSGKSFKAKKLAGTNGVIYSTDDFFMVKGQYVYDPSKIGENHAKNQARTIEAMKKSTELIIIDNTNIKLWEMRPYVEAADKYGYDIRVELPQTEWAWDAKKCGSKNSHGVPKDKIEIMISNFEQMQSIDEIRTAKDNRRRNNHRHK